MKTKAYIPGLKNSQKAFVIVNGVGWRTTVGQLSDMVFTTQSTAVRQVLESMAREKITGRSTTMRVYDHKMEPVSVEVQISLY